MDYQGAVILHADANKNGVSKDDRRDLLGHKSGDVTDLYWAKELTRMLENTNKVTQQKGKLILWKRAV
jgi:hypothetical protein